MKLRNVIRKAAILLAATCFIQAGANERSIEVTAQAKILFHQREFQPRWKYGSPGKGTA